MLKRSSTTAVLAMLLLALPSIASAQPANDAERTFQQGLVLFDAGKIGEACAMFEESFAIDRAALGTLQNLAACHERDGKRARALREWIDLASRAQRAAKVAQESLARQHVADLSSRLPRLVLRANHTIMSMAIDGESLDPRAWDKPISIDPGKHEITFSAAGYKSVTQTIVADFRVALLEVDVPALEKDAVSSPTPTPTPTPTPATATAAPHFAHRSSLSSPAGWLVGGTGLLFLGVGSYFGVSAIGHRSDSDAECPAGRCSARGVELNDRATTEAWLSNVGVGLGLVATGVALYLLLVSRPSSGYAARSSFTALSF